MTEPNEIEIMRGTGELGKSRSQKKRESTALQETGEALAALGLALLDELDLPADLHGALHDLRSIKKHEARRRQMQLIGRYMRELEEEELQRVAVCLDRLNKKQRSETDGLHGLEAWREALINEDSREETLALIAAEYPGVELKKLRHLAAAAAAERASGKVKSFRELFRYLKLLSPGS